MVLREKLIALRQLFFNKLEEITLNIAIKFGYPENPGMPLIPTRVDSNGLPYLGFRVYDNDILSIRKVPISGPPIAKNYIEILFGTFPTADPVKKHFYESKDDGFYGFYIENYKNLFFLPNGVSEFLQIHFNFCIDITLLEVIREVLFLGCVGFAEIVSLRILLAWLITINPYTFPWNYFIALVDWTEESLVGFVPTVIGVDLTGSLVLTIVGKIADSLNNLVFTMPYLPSEGDPAKIFLNGEVRDVLAFRYLPILWYKYPIPNKIRQYWYTERPDILKYMERAYKNFDIQFLPDELIQNIKAKSFDINGSLPLLEEIISRESETEKVIENIEPQSFQEIVHTIQEIIHLFEQGTQF